MKGYCCECAAFQPTWNHYSNKYGPEGVCRRHAPTGSGDYPRTTQDGWCCEFVLSATAATATAAAAASAASAAARASASAAAAATVPTKAAIRNDILSLIEQSIRCFKDDPQLVAALHKLKILFNLEPTK